MVQPRMVPSGLAMDLDESVRGALALGPVVLAIGHAVDANAAMALARFGFRQSDLGKFGVGIDHARNVAGARVRPQPEQRIPDDETGLVIGEMGEARSADHVANGVDAAIGGPEMVVHLDAGVSYRRSRRASRLSDLTFGLRPVATRRWRAFDTGGLAVLGEMHGDPLRRALDALHPRVGVKHHLRVGQTLDENGGGVGVFMGEEAPDIEHADMGAEHAMGLGKLEPDRRRRPAR